MNRLGIDLGGTWMRLCLASADGKIIRRKRLPAVAWESLPRALRRLRKRWKWGRLDGLTVGSRGIWRNGDRKVLASALKPLAKQVNVLSDMELAHQAAFGGGKGILVIAGTGSVAYGVDDRGRKARAGGLGPLLGDEGSAFWIGRQALNHPRLRKRLPKGLAVRLAHSPNVVRDTAALAARVLGWAKRDAGARSIRREGARELAGLVVQLTRKLGFRGRIPVAWHGSLFSDKAFREDFRREVTRKGNRYQIGAPVMACEVAASRPRAA